MFSFHETYIVVAQTGRTPVPGHNLPKHTRVILSTIRPVPKSTMCSGTICRIITLCETTPINQTPTLLLSIHLFLTSVISTVTTVNTIIKIAVALLGEGHPFGAFLLPDNMIPTVYIAIADFCGELAAGFQAFRLQSWIN